MTSPSEYLKEDKIDPNDLKYATDDFRVDTHPNQGVIIETGGQKKSHALKSKSKKGFLILNVYFLNDV